MSQFRTIAKNTVSLLSGQLISKVLMVFYAGIVARYLLVEGMGQIGTASALCGLTFVLVNLGLDTLLVRDVARDKSLSASYVFNVIIIKLTMGLIAFGVLYVVASLGPYSSTAYTIIFIYYINSLLMAFLNVFRALFQAHERMEYDAILQVSRDILNIGLTVWAIKLGASIFVIVGISVFATAVKLAAFCFIARLKILPRLTIFFRLDFGLLKNILKICLPFTLLSVVTTIYAQLSGILLPILGSEKEMGYYSVALYVFMTIQLIPGMFSQSIFPVFSKLYNSQEHLRRVYEKSFRVITIVSVYIAIQTVLLADLGITLIFGKDFYESIIVLQILGVMLMLSASYVSGSILNATGRQVVFLKSYIMFIIVQLSLNLLLIPKYGASGAALAYLFTTCCGFIFYTWYCHKCLTLDINWSVGIKLVLSGFCTAVICYGMLKLSWPILAVSMISTIIYALFIYLFKMLKKDEYERILESAYYFLKRLNLIFSKEIG